MLDTFFYINRNFDVFLIFWKINLIFKTKCLMWQKRDNICNLKFIEIIFDSVKSNISFALTSLAHSSSSANYINNCSTPLCNTFYTNNAMSANPLYTLIVREIGMVISLMAWAKTKIILDIDFFSIFAVSVADRCFIKWKVMVCHFQLKYRMVQRSNKK